VEVSGEAYEGSRVLVTGGLGFIGSNLARSLVASGADVTLVDSLIPQYGGNLHNIEGLASRLTINVCDIRDPYAIRHLLDGVDFLFNLAGQTSHIDSMTDPRTDLAINTSSQIELLESCRAVAPNCRVVFASTRQVYGRPEYLPVDELHPIHPVDVNGINKWAGESYHRLYSEVYDLAATVLRLTNTYGPGMRVKDARQTFLGVWIRCVLEGRPFQVFGDGRQLRDFNYVSDVVDALLLAGSEETARGKIYNLGSHEVIDLQSLADVLIKLVTGSSYEVVPFPPDRKAIDIGDYYGSFGLIERELGWTPKVSIGDGLAMTVEYYERAWAYYWDSLPAPFPNEV
jgi:dTDP-glucose 4,6-dehydratase/UDP-glucose 4-epimerase